MSNYTPGGDKTTIRWRNTGTSFVLEQWKLENPRGPTRGVWVEVPCVEAQNDELKNAGPRTPDVRES